MLPTVELLQCLKTPYKPLPALSSKVFVMWTIQLCRPTELKTKAKVKLAKVHITIFSKSTLAHKKGIHRGLPIKAEYESKQKLSIVSSSTVSFATRNMIDHFALSPKCCGSWLRSQENRAVSSKTLYINSLDISRCCTPDPGD